MNQPPVIVDVFQQPISSLPKWKALGINALVNTVSGPGEDVPTPAAYCAAAHVAGFYVIADCPESDAWAHPDEADGKGFTPEAIQKQYQVWKTLDPSKPVYLNLDGRRRQWTSLATYQAYAAGCDILSMDRYVVEWGQPTSDFALIAGDVDVMKQVGAGKLLHYIIGASQQNLELSPALYGSQFAPLCRMPTGAEVTLQAALVKQHGIQALGFFTHNPYGCGETEMPDGTKRKGGGWCTFDSTTADTRAAIQAFAASVTKPTMQPGPLDGHPVTVDGHDYVFKAR